MSRSRKSRADLFAQLNQAMRDVSGRGVLYSQVVASKLGIAPTDLECLDWIVREPQTAGALATVTGLTTGAITGVIDRLERAGFAKREPDPNDRRKVLVRALPAVFKQIIPLYAPMEKTAMESLAKYSEAELALILDFMTRAHESAGLALAELQKIKPRKA